MRIAARVRLDKENHPEFFCGDPRCLWRTGGLRGTPCQKHPELAAANAARWRSWVQERETRIVHDVTPAEYERDHGSLTAAERNPGMGRKW